MPIDRFGYSCLSIDEVIEALTALRDQDARRGGEPIWIGMRDRGVYCPVDRITLGSAGEVFIGVAGA